MITITKPADLAQFPVGAMVQFEGTNGPVSEVTISAALTEAAALATTAATATGAATAPMTDAPWTQSVGPFNSAGFFVVTVTHASGRKASRTIKIG